MGTLLIACPSCSRHAFAREVHCPSCGALLRASDGSIQRTAGALLLGLTLTASGAACANDVSTASGGAGRGGAGMGGIQAVSAYGVGVTTVSGGGMGGIQAVSAYGVGVTTVTSGGGGAGGAGDAGTDDGGTGDAGT